MRKCSESYVHPFLQQYESYANKMTKTLFWRTQQKELQRSDIEWSKTVQTKLSGNKKCTDNDKSKDAGEVCSGGNNNAGKKWSVFEDDLRGTICVEFEYLGCGGTPNRFDTKEECEHLCVEGKGQGV